MTVEQALQHILFLKGERAEEAYRRCVLGEDTQVSLAEEWGTSNETVRQAAARAYSALRLPEDPTWYWASGLPLKVRNILFGLNYPAWRVPLLLSLDHLKEEVSDKGGLQHLDGVGPCVERIILEWLKEQ